MTTPKRQWCSSGPPAAVFPARADDVLNPARCAGRRPRVAGGSRLLASTPSRVGQYAVCLLDRLTTQRLLCVALFVTGIAQAGCTTFYRAETVLHADGSVERAVYQPAEDARQVAEQRMAWPHWRRVSEVSEQQWKAGIADLPQSDLESSKYWIAWGQFPSPAEIPEHLRFPTPDDRDGAALRRDYQRLDLGLVVEHSWSEVLTDVVTLPGAQVALDEIVDSLRDDLALMLERGLGAEYDFAPVLQWIDTEGRRWVQQAVLAIYDIAARDLPEAERTRRLAQELADISARYGLELRDESGAPQRAVLEGDQRVLAETMFSFVQQKLRALLQRKNRQPVPETVWVELETVLRHYKNGDQPDASPPDEAAQRALERWREIARQMVTTRYGGQEQYKRVYARRLSRVAGVHNFPTTLGQRLFRYHLTMPGRIVETNGRLLANDQVVFVFAARDAFPFGYAMRAVSLHSDPEVQQRVLGKVRLEQLGQLRQYVDLVSDSAVLRATMVRCVRSGNLDELRQHRQRLEVARDVDGLEVLDRLQSLLGM